MNAPLSGVKVLDLSNYIAGPFCTRLLAGFGADVIKIERPSGDPIRHWGPFPDQSKNPETGAIHLYVNQGKRSLVLDLETDDGREHLNSLLDWADVLVESYRPGTMEKWGFSYEKISIDHPGLIYLSVTDFGQDGPYSNFVAWEITTYALSGLMMMTGDPEKEPLKNGGYLGQYGTGHNAFNALLVALWERNESGLGQHVDVSIFECVGSLLEYGDMYWIYKGEIHPRFAGGLRAAWGVYPASDGYVGVVSGPERRWRQITQVIDSEELADEKFFQPGATSLLRDEIDALLITATVQQKKEELYHRAQSLGMPFGFVATPSDFLKSEQLAFRNFFERIEHPVVGWAHYPTIAARFNDQLWHSVRAPLLGEHNNEIASQILQNKDLSSTDNSGDQTLPSEVYENSFESITLTGPRRGVFPNIIENHGDFVEDLNRTGPLKDIVILDLSMVWAGPYAIKLMTDLGAMVIKIEVNSHLDSVRGQVPAVDGVGVFANDRFAEDSWNRAGYFNKLNRGKFGICLNIVEPEGRKIMHELIAKADIVIENFGGGVFERMGYGYQVLKNIKDDIIFVSMPPSGNGGPEGNYVGYGVAIEQLGGIVARTGYAGEPPMKSGINHGDPIAGIHTMGYIMTALHHHRNTGRGSYVDLSQREAAICWLGDEIVEYELTGNEPIRIGNRDEFMAPSGVYRCTGEDAWIALACGSLSEWQALAKIISPDNLFLDDDLSTFEGRSRRHDEIDQLISSWTAGYTPDEAMILLQSVGVAAGTCSNSQRFVEDPHLDDRDFFKLVHHKSVGQHIVPGIPWKFSRTPGEIHRAAPQLGQHTNYILKEILGKSEEEISSLWSTGVLENIPLKLLENENDAK